MADNYVRAVDNNEILLDNDGNPIRELSPDSADARRDAQTSIAQIAAAQRSWRYGHVIVDEAQDLTPMQWRMVARRARGGAMTVVGDLAQRSIGEPGQWQDHLPASLDQVSFEELTINYRSPREVNDVAAGVLAELAPDLRPARAIRSFGEHPLTIQLDDLGSSLQDMVRGVRSERPDGRLAVIGAEGIERTEIDGVQWIGAWQSKGLEFDHVVLVEPARILDQLHGLSLLFVALTRTTGTLTIAHRRPLPDVLVRSLDVAKNP